MRLPALRRPDRRSPSSAARAAAPRRAERSVPRGWLGVVADGPLTSGGAMDRRVGPDGRQRRASPCGRRSTGPARSAAAPAPPDLAHLDARRRCRPRARGLPRAADRDRARPAGRRSATGRRDLAAARPGALRGVPARARRPLRPAGLVLGRAPRAAARADPRVADLERAEPHALLDRAQPFAPQLRAAAARGARARCAPPTRARTIVSPGCRTRAGSRCARIYKAGGARPFDAVALHPYTRQAAQRGAARAVRAAGDAPATATARMPVWITELSLAGREGQARRTAIGFETTDARPGEAARRRRCGCSPRARKRLRIERVFWYTWLSTRGAPNSFDYSGLRRLRERRRRVDAGAAACSATRRAGSRAARKAPARRAPLRLADRARTTRVDRRARSRPR